MSTLTEKIAQELLNAAGDPDKVDEVLKSNKGSRGPFYHALTQATCELTKRLADVDGKLRETEKKCNEREMEWKTVGSQLDELRKEVTAKADELNSLEERRKEVEKVVMEAHMLGALGFGAEELRRVAELLGETAASQGLPPGDGVTQFFNTMKDYGVIVSLELQTKQAEARAAQGKAEAQRWEAEAKAREARGKARITTIDMVDGWLAKGIKEKDLPQWAMILDKAGIELDGLAKRLQKCGSIEGLYRDRESEAKSLQKEVHRSEARLKALKAEESQIKEAIATIREAGLAEIKAMASQTFRHLETLMAKAAAYGKLERQAASLESEVVIARAIKDNIPELWTGLPPQAVQRLLMGLLQWSAKGTDNPGTRVAPPEPIRKAAALASWNRLTLTELLTWACYILLPEEEKKVVDRPR